MSRPGRVRSLVRLVVSLFLISIYAAVQGGPSLYEFGEVELKGVVVLEEKNGAPGFENDGVSPKVQVKMLQLDQAISVEPKDPGSREFHPVKFIKLIQLVALSGVDLSTLAGHRIVVKGTLEGARTGHRYTKAILVVAKTDDAKVLSAK